MRFSTHCFQWIGLALLTALSPISIANMQINRAIINFEPGKNKQQDVVVHNSGNDPLYVQVEPFIIQNPGTEQQTREAFTDPRKAGLLVTPNKLVIPAKGTKRVRFVNLKPVDENERIYRVVLKPVVGEVTGESSGIKVLIAYEVLLLVQPTNPEPNLITRREGNSLHFHNAGNVNVLLREGTQCPADETPKEECSELPGKRL